MHTREGGLPSRRPALGVEAFQPENEVWGDGVVSFPGWRLISIKNPHAFPHLPCLQALGCSCVTRDPPWVVSTCLPLLPLLGRESLMLPREPRGQHAQGLRPRGPGVRGCGKGRAVETPRLGWLLTSGVPPSSAVDLSSSSISLPYRYPGSFSFPGLGNTHRRGRTPGREGGMEEDILGSQSSSAPACWRLTRARGRGRVCVCARARCLVTSE